MTTPPENTPAIIPGSIKDADVYGVGNRKIDWKLSPFTPPDAPTVDLAGAGAGNVDNGDHSVAVTFVNAAGETTVGAASTPVTVAAHGSDGKLAYSDIPTGPPGTTARNLYRTAADTTEPFLLVDTISDNSTTTYTDNTADADLGVQPPTENGTAAPIFLEGSLSTVADAPAKAVLASMRDALVALVDATDGTS